MSTSDLKITDTEKPFMSKTRSFYDSFVTRNKVGNQTTQLECYVIVVNDLRWKTGVCKPNLCRSGKRFKRTWTFSNARM